jgi:ABC-2 type transport system permease protein
MSKTLFFHLLYPKFKALSYFYQKEFKLIPFLLILSLGLLCMLGCWYGGYFIVGQIFRVEMIADLLVQKLIYFVLESISWVLMFSTMLSAFSTHYLSQDLGILISSPISTTRLYINRSIEAWLQSSWMALVFVYPFLCSLSWYIDVHYSFYLWTAFALFLLTLICSFLACAIVVLLARIFPAKRIQESLVIATVLGFIYLYARFHASRPDRFFREDGFKDLIALIQGLNHLGTNHHWWDFSNLSAWTTDCIFGALMQKKALAESINIHSNLYYFGYLIAVLIIVATISMIIAQFTYLQGYWLAQEGLGQNTFKFRKGKLPTIALNQSQNLRQKDSRLFWRNQSQWTQLLLVGSLCVVYIFNFKYFKLLHYSGFFNHYTLFYMHIALSGMILITISARFLYPSISQEGKAVWILQSAPISCQDILYAKLIWFAKPLLLFALLLCMTAIYLTGMNIYWFFLMLWAELLLIAGILGLALGMGAISPRFDLANPMQVAASFGGTAFMLLALLYMILLSASLHWIIYAFVIQQDQLFDKVDLWKIIVSGIFAHVISYLFFKIPLKIAEKRLNQIWIQDI